ncbi:MAG: class I SAM-dependent methyltransferase [Deinococcota bacterium]
MVKDFYDELSPFYHLIFADWDASIQRQASILNGIITSEWGNDAATVVDVSCGIGTQAIGLASFGYTVEASDLSPKAIQRAKTETEKRNLAINYSVADMRYAFDHHAREFDVLISCDNSVPHLLSDDEILEAFKQFFRCVKPGGGCLVTLRDYDQEPREGIQVKPYGVRIEQNVKYIVFQTWEFKDTLYNLSMYFITDKGGDDVQTTVMRSQYYAIGILRIIELMQAAAFTNVRQVESDFYQPVIVGTKAP